MTLKEAKEIINRFEKAKSFADYDGYSAVLGARMYLEALQGPEVKSLIEALEKIENGDYRGNRPESSSIAYHALQKFKEAVEMK